VLYECNCCDGRRASQGLHSGYCVLLKRFLRDGFLIREEWEGDLAVLAVCMAIVVLVVRATKA